MSIQRDNQIAEQEARIKSLEKGLARYLKSQVRSEVVAPSIVTPHSVGPTKVHTKK